ncbi:tripartite tricarboxylate transporter TctB family protein [Microbulbifer sp. S227A]|uniref:tripartite tricarboxylate transporter TctB family protein n=1 Tax=Microbulbifer sp. S227A TaxID=3415131 RepID=UPI003C7CB61D
MKQARVDLFSGLALAAFALVLYYYLIPNYVDGSEFDNTMSPRFFPNLGAMLIFGGGVLLVLPALWTLKSGIAVHGAPPVGGRPLRALLAALAMAGFVVLFQWVGYFVAAPALIVSLILIFGGRNPVVIALVAAVTTGVLFLLFNYALNLPLI